MSGPKHTPGPYEAKGDIVYKDGVPVAFVCHPKERPSEERRPGETWLDMRERTQPQRAAIQAQMVATAQLLAAAPRLAEALKGVMNSFEAHVYLKEPPTDPDEYDLMMQPLWEEARAALREAGGEQ